MRVLAFSALFALLSVCHAQSRPWRVISWNTNSFSTGVSFVTEEIAFQTGFDWNAIQDPDRNLTRASIKRTVNSGRSWEECPREQGYIPVQLLYTDVVATPNFVVTNGISFMPTVLVQGLRYSRDENAVFFPVTRYSSNIFMVGQHSSTVRAVTNLRDTFAAPGVFEFTTQGNPNLQTAQGMLLSRNGIDYGIEAITSNVVVPGTRVVDGAFPGPTTWFLVASGTGSSSLAFRLPLAGLLQTLPHARTQRLQAALEQYAKMYEHNTTSRDEKESAALGVIYRFSAISGRGWEVVYTTGDAALKTIKCPTPLFCIALGVSGSVTPTAASSFLFTTNNGGTTWRQVYRTPVGVREVLEDVACANDNECWVSGSRGSGLETTGLFMHSRNGGESWERQSTEALIFPGVMSVLPLPHTPDRYAVYAAAISIIDQGAVVMRWP